MSSRSPLQLEAKAVVGSFIIGVIFVVLFTWMNGNTFGTPVFPLLAMTSAFILSGAVYGYLSEGETVLEPAAAGVLVAIAGYAIITGLDLRCFANLEFGEYTKLMVIAFLNGITLTFAGAWAGEKLERTYSTESEAETAPLEWGWLTAGVLLGLAVSLFLANAAIWLMGLAVSPYAALEPGYAWVLLIVLFLGLEATGFVCAFRSPGDTSYEAAIAGYITVVFLIDVFVLTLGGQEILSLTRLAIVLFIGILASLVGGYIGERRQAAVETGPDPSQATP
jgi:hypothetical protein